MLEEQLKFLKVSTQFRPIDAEENDIRVIELINTLNIKGKKILDIGSLDGYHGVMLSKAGAIVTCTDIRPENLVSCLCRNIYHGIKNTQYIMLDVDELKSNIKKDEYDIIFHSGVFYHLANPVEHLFKIAQLSKYILLETHVANPDLYKESEIIYNNIKYKGTLYPDGGWKNICGSKETQESFWLERADLKKLISKCNLKIEKVIYEDMQNPHGERVCYLLKRIDKNEQ